VTFNNLLELSQLNLSKEPIMAFNVRSILGRNSAQQSPAPQRSEDRPAPRRKLPGEMSKERPSASTQRQSTAPAKPNIDRTESGRVAGPHSEMTRDHLEAMDDKQLTDHWQKTSTDPKAQSKKGSGGVDLNDPRVKDSINEMSKRKISPFQTQTQDRAKGNDVKYDKTGKMDAKFYQPLTSSTEKVAGKGRANTSQNERPPGASPRR